MGPDLPCRSCAHAAGAHLGQARRQLTECLHRLPERIRPSTLAFGGLADGFLPFEVADKTVELRMASIVMKVVQAQHPGVPAVLPSAGKIGDDASASKAQGS